MLSQIGAGVSMFCLMVTILLLSLVRYVHYDKGLLAVLCARSQASLCLLQGSTILP